MFQVHRANFRAVAGGNEKCKSVVSVEVQQVICFVGVLYFSLVLNGVVGGLEVASTCLCIFVVLYSNVILANNPMNLKPPFKEVQKCIRKIISNNKVNYTLS